MSRRIYLQMAAPPVLIGLALFATCLIGYWYSLSVQRRLSETLVNNATSLQAAQELEASLRQLRFHSLMRVMDPTPQRKVPIAEDHQDFEKALDAARRTAATEKEHELIAEIVKGYQRYRAELESPATSAAPRTIAELVRWAEAHPVRHIVAPCRELHRVNQKEMEEGVADAEQTGRWARWAMLLLSVIGATGGLLAGYGVARGLNRSIAQLQVRVEDVRAELEQDVGSVRLSVGTGLDNLEDELAYVLSRVREVVGRLQRQQQEMLRTEQLAAVGQLAAGIAHNVRNPLTAIKMLVGAAVRSGRPQPLNAEDLRVIHGEVERLERTVQELLDFARPSPPQRSPCDLREAALHSLNLVRARAEGQSVVIETELPEELVIVEADAGQIGNVLINLLLNALDAMPRGGRLHLSLYVEDGIARLSVADSGQGIAPEIADRLFTPFVSTKPAGTGLGLSISRRVVAEHGGDIAAGAAPGGGACFTITLPAHVREDTHADLACR